MQEITHFLANLDLCALLKVLTPTTQLNEFDLKLGHLKGMYLFVKIP